MFTYVIVGKTVVGAFADYTAAAACLQQLAPGTKARIKKGHRPSRPAPKLLNRLGVSDKGQQMFYNSRVRAITQPHKYNKITYLKDGDFKL